MKILFKSFACFLSFCLVSQLNAEPVKVKVTEQVIQSGLRPVGLNLDWNTYWATPCMKDLVTENFEGSTYRQIHTCYVQDAGGAASWSPISEGWKNMFKEHGTWRIVSGPAKGQSGKIMDIVKKNFTHQGKEKEFTYIVFDKSVPAGSANTGIALEAFLPDEGYMYSDKVTWNKGANELVHGDNHPGAFGNSALLMKNPAGESSYLFIPAFQYFIDNAGTWKVSLWAKKKGGSPSLKIDCGAFASSANIPLSPEWKKHEVMLNVVKALEKPDQGVMFKLVVNGGEVLIDDIAISKQDGQKNPTQFRDAFVENVKSYNPGQLRFLQMGGSTMENFLQLDPLRRQAFSSMLTVEPGKFREMWKHDFGLPAFLQLCEAVGADPWINLPGIITETELNQFLEFMGAPADTGFGKLRRKQGREKPWTESFRNIHIEYGNEAWNFSVHYQLGGFNGPDYWEGLTKQIKKSPYSTAKYLVHAGAQSVNTWTFSQILANNPSADAFCVAPYWISGMRTYPNDFFPLLSDDAFMVRFAAASIHRTIEGTEGYMNQEFKTASKSGKQLSTYEENYTGWTGKKELSDDRRDAFMYGYGPAIACVNGYLMLQKLGIRYQNQFTVSGKTYGASARPSDGQDIPRPVGTALKLVNQLDGGDMLATVVTGSPTIPMDTYFETLGGNKKMAYNDTPALNAYAYKDGNRRSLILVNVDPEKELDVSVELPSAPGKTVRKLVLTGSIKDRVADFAKSTPFSIKETTDDKFTSGATVKLAPCSIIGYGWEE